jgi:hypothetical protein
METNMSAGKLYDYHLALAIAAAVAIATEERILLEEGLIDEVHQAVFADIDTADVQAA